MSGFLKESDGLRRLSKADLVARANHTGFQSIPTITGLPDTLAGIDTEFNDIALEQAAQDLAITARPTSVALALSTGAAAIGSNDGAGGTLWTNLGGLVTRLLSSAGASVIGFIQLGTGAVFRTLQDRLRDTVSVKDFGAVCNGVVDDTVAVQKAIDYCAANGWPDLVIPGRCYIAGILYIDREVDATQDEFYITGTGRKSGFITDRAGAIFSSTFINPVAPLSEFVCFEKIHFSTNDNTINAYAVDGNRFLRMRFDRCYFFRINCAKTNNYLQQYIFSHCNIRFTLGWFIEATTGSGSPNAGTIFHLDWDTCTFEKGSRGIATTGFAKAVTQIAGSCFVAGVFQGNYGPFIETGACVGVDIGGIYFELNTAPEIEPGSCLGLNIHGNLFDNPIAGGDKYCVNATLSYNLKSSGNYCTNRFYSAALTTLGATDSGLVSECDNAVGKLVDNLPGTGAMTGSFTATVNGFTPLLTPTVKYEKHGRMIMLSWDDTYATSDATGMIMYDIPALLLPTGQNIWASVPIQDNSVIVGHAHVKINSDGLTFYKDFALGAFTASGTKGIAAFTLAYRI